MIKLGEYSVLPKELLKEGMNLKINVHVHLPQNESIIHFRRMGDVLTKDDMEQFQKIKPENLLFNRSEINALYEMGTNAAELELLTGDVSGPALKATAATALKCLNSGQDLIKSIEGISVLVQNLVSQFKKSPSSTAYDEALKRASIHAKDPLTAHHQQVSSIAALMGITVGNFSMDELADIAAAGLIHDLGLKDITHDLASSHIKEIRKLSNQEKIIYLRHIEFTLEKIKTEKLPITPGVKRIIELHHENWDGSGFTSYVGMRIYRPARLLRIADDLVSFIQDRTQNLGFNSALEILAKERGMYDPVMIDALINNSKSN